MFTLFPKKKKKTSAHRLLNCYKTWVGKKKKRKPSFWVQLIIWRQLSTIQEKEQLSFLFYFFLIWEGSSCPSHLNNFCSVESFKIQKNVPKKKSVLTNPLFWWPIYACIWVIHSSLPKSECMEDHSQEQKDSSKQLVLARFPMVMSNNLQ